MDSFIVFWLWVNKQCRRQRFLKGFIQIKSKQWKGCGVFIRMPNPLKQALHFHFNCSTLTKTSKHSPFNSFYLNPTWWACEICHLVAQSWHMQITLWQFPWKEATSSWVLSFNLISISIPIKQIQNLHPQLTVSFFSFCPYAMLSTHNEQDREWKEIICVKSIQAW